MKIFYNDQIGAYQVVKPDKFSDSWHEARYNELTGKYFTVTKDGDNYTIGFKVLQAVKGAEGLATDSELNGGYKEVNGGLLFVDDVDDKTGMLASDETGEIVYADGLFDVKI